MLTSTLRCAICGGPMYRIGSGGGTKPHKTAKGTITHQKNGPRKIFYYCKNRKGCKNMLPLPEMDSRVSEAIVSMYGDLPHRVIGVVPGDDHAEELAQLQMDLAGLDWLDSASLAKAGAIQAEMIRVSQLPPTAPTVEVISDGRTVADVWNALDADGRRQWLIDHGWRIEASRDESGEIILNISGGELDDDAIALSQLSAKVQQLPISRSADAGAEAA